jgi:hypothetical protein
MGRDTRRHTTPGMVSTDSSVSLSFCAWWNWRMLSYATSNAAFTSGSSSGSGRSCAYPHAKHQWCSQGEPGHVSGSLCSHAAQHLMLMTLDCCRVFT